MSPVPPQLSKTISTKLDFLGITSGSDFHLGNHRVNSAHLTRNYVKVLFPYLVKSKYFWMVGDLLDRAIVLADPQSGDVLDFIEKLLVELDKHGVTARFLRGTFTHDRIQLGHVQRMHRNFGLKNDLRVIDNIELEEMPDGLRLLYLPDDLPQENADQVLELVHTMMADRGWDYVDYALVHGCFDFVGFGERIAFRPEQFAFVRRKVLVGHIHTAQSEGNVIYHGSPERFSHGEEEAKGFLFIEDRYPKEVKATFVENTHSTWFKTFDDSRAPLDSIVSIWTERFDSAPQGCMSNFRLIHPDPATRAVVEKISRGYPNVVFSSIPPKDKNTQKAAESIVAKTYVAGKIPTQETLPEDILDFIKESGADTTLDKDKIKKYLT